MKKIIVLICMLLPMGVFSQEVKIAVVDWNEVFGLMPELSEVETQLAAFTEGYQKDLQAMDDEYKIKMEEFIKLQDTLTENLKLRRQQELQELENRIQTFLPVAQQDIENKHVELMTPVQAKLQKAIQDVGNEQGYTVIIHPQALLYQGTAIDATPLVKAKLGLQ